MLSLAHSHLLGDAGREAKWHFYSLMSGPFIYVLVTRDPKAAISR